MMRGKHFPQNSDLMKTKSGGTTDDRNAKVTVQYIQNPHLFQKPDNVNHNVHVAAQEDLEVENVEYLEENTNVEEYIEDSAEKEEDIFYPNAIHCLLDLYKNRYETMITENPTVKVSHLWLDIAKEMQESFFEFNERQIQQKYISLREQYFSVQNKHDIENFDYFEQLHEIYKDQSKENIIRGYSGSKKCSYYKDEIFMQSDEIETNERNMHDFKSEEIVHKEHEFIDMVEKELQAMEDGLQVEENKETAKNEDVDLPSNKLESMASSSEQQPPSKRARVDDKPHEETMQTKNKSVFVEINTLETSIAGNETANDFSLYQYNKEQERRHRENISLLEKSLKIQERALEQQQQLLQELIKRLPS